MSWLPLRLLLPVDIRNTRALFVKLFVYLALALTLLSARPANRGQGRSLWTHPYVPPTPATDTVSRWR